jgi:hypothetical protein
MASKTFFSQTMTMKNLGVHIRELVESSTTRLGLFNQKHRVAHGKLDERLSVWSL